jgi:hypothetical protein
MRTNLLLDIDFFSKQDSHFNCRRDANSSCSSNAYVSGSAVGSAYKDTSPDRTERSEDRLLVRDTFDRSHSSARQVPKDELSCDNSAAIGRVGRIDREQEGALLVQARNRWFADPAPRNWPQT